MIVLVLKSKSVLNLKVNMISKLMATGCNEHEAHKIHKLISYSSYDYMNIFLELLFIFPTAILKDVQHKSKMGMKSTLTYLDTGKEMHIIYDHCNGCFMIRNINTIIG